MSMCISCVDFFRYMCCIKVHDHDGRSRIFSDDSLTSIPDETMSVHLPSKTVNTKQSQYKKIAMWSAYVSPSL